MANAKKLSQRNGPLQHRSGSTLIFPWTWKSHFSTLSQSLLAGKHGWCAPPETENRWEYPLYAQQQQKISLSMLLMSTWKMAGALVRPNGITKYSKCLNWVSKAVFHSSPSFLCARWYAFWRSKIFSHPTVPQVQIWITVRGSYSLPLSYLDLVNQYKAVVCYLFLSTKKTQPREERRMAELA